MNHADAVDERTAAPHVYALALALARQFFTRYVTVHVQGADNVPAAGLPTVLAANHSSALDLFVAGYAVGRPAHFLAKAEITGLPVIGGALKSLGAIPTRRDEKDTAALRATLAALQSGGLVGLAPEGTRSRDGSVGAYDPGFVWLALRADARILPCAIHGAHALMPKGARIPRRGAVWVRFAPPIPLAGAGRRLPRARLQEIADEVRTVTVAMLEDLAAATGVPLPEGSVETA